jgi:hypothetical protein
LFERTLFYNQRRARSKMIRIASVGLPASSDQPNASTKRHAQLDSDREGPGGRPQDLRQSSHWEERLAGPRGAPRSAGDRGLSPPPHDLLRPGRQYRFFLVDWPPAFKCDVEGAEDEVVRGGANTLREWHPTIVCEMHSMDNQFALIRYLREPGYPCRLLDQNHVLALFA